MTTRGQGRLFKKPGSANWHMEFWIDGEACRKTTGTADEAAAQAVLARTRQAMLDGEITGDEDRVTVETLRQLLLANYKAKKNRSTATMPYSFKHVVAFFRPKTKGRRLRGKIVPLLGR